jgi:hypothetical protein
MQNLYVSSSMLPWTAECKAVCSSSQAQTSGYGFQCHRYQSWCSIDDTPEREIEDLFSLFIL